ncbi:tRNA (guanosine(46)-N7)-methyltransferase TrmB [Inmirania thermothiophila]|uniref:tRNA (guanine-N(7)-)-methyltransferase n=1 Tax=Inmirania thermothiophila TaxID=1750597 RepID=A0A3N1YAG6_9GAMM|nr:tRNA (guanosine(46)-N7)-methyltransferase TrmB [Inmirania thermothiophila]ROR34622.1 tRNA (guanine-N(7)-)-methyltransferase [Inmirania thermothiophila]
MTAPTQEGGPAQTRRIRSFVRREGRMTAAQRRALATLWPRYGLEPRGVLDLDAAFGRRARRTLEIGFGNGEALLTLARTALEEDFLGIEVHRPGVGHLLLGLEREGLGNVRVICDDAVEVLSRHLPAASLDRILIWFPDPWPKKRHHKRRLVQPPFVRELLRVLRPGGLLHLATDWPDYAEHMVAVLEAEPGLINLEGPGRFAPRPPWRPRTRFEARGERLGHPVLDLLYRRREGA